MFKRLLFRFNIWLNKRQERKYIKELINHYTLYFDSKYSDRKVSDIKEITNLIRYKYLERISSKESSLSFEKLIIKDRINRYNDLSLMTFVSLYIPMLASYGFTYFTLRNNVPAPMNLTALTMFTCILILMSFYYTLSEFKSSWKSRSKRNFYYICLEVLEELELSNRLIEENCTYATTLNKCIDEVAVSKEARSCHVIKISIGDKKSIYRIKSKREY